MKEDIHKDIIDGHTIISPLWDESLVENVDINLNEEISFDIFTKSPLWNEPSDTPCFDLSFSKGMVVDSWECMYVAYLV